MILSKKRTSRRNQSSKKPSNRQSLSPLTLQPRSISLIQQVRLSPNPVSPENIKQLQPVIGNRATKQLLGETIQPRPSQTAAIKPLAISGGPATLQRFTDQQVKERAQKLAETDDRGSPENNYIEAKIQVRAHELASGDTQKDYYQAKAEVEQAWRLFELVKAGTPLSETNWSAMEDGLSNEEFAIAKKKSKVEKPPSDEEFLAESVSGNIALVSPRALYATEEVINQANKELAEQGSFVQFAPGAPWKKTELVQVIPLRNEKRKPRKGSEQEGPWLANSPNKEERQKARFGTNFNAERNPFPELEKIPEEEKQNIAVQEYQEKVLKDVETTFEDYATFADCFYNTAYAMGAEEVAPLDPDKLDERKPMEKKQLISANVAREGAVVPHGKTDPASIGAMSWLNKVIPTFPEVLRSKGKDKKCPALIARIEGSKIQSIPLDDYIKRFRTEGLPEGLDWGKELWDLYNAIMDDPVARRVLAETYKVNEGIGTPKVGEGMAAINNPHEWLEADNAVKKGKEGAVEKWNFHWVPVVMVDGPNYVLLENAAGDSANRANIDTYRWRFKLLGPTNTFHDEARRDTHTTEHYLTLPFGKLK